MIRDFNTLIKYFMEGLSVTLALMIISGANLLKLNYRSTIFMAVTIMLTFLILDTFTSEIAEGARQGMGFTMGHGMFTESFRSQIENAVGDDVVEITGEPIEATDEHVEGFTRMPSEYYEEGFQNASNVNYNEDYDITSNENVNENFACGVYPESDSCVKVCANDCLTADSSSAAVDCLIPQPSSWGGKFLTRTAAGDNQYAYLENEPHVNDNKREYKVVPGLYSKYVLQPGYSECVQPHNGPALTKHSGF